VITEGVLRSSRYASKVRGRSYTIKLEALFAFPGRLWYWDDESPSVLGLHARTVDFDARRAYTIWEGQQAATLSVGDPTQEAWRLELMQAAELLETRWMQLHPVRTWLETKGKVTSLFVECKFKTARGGATAVFTLDAVTFLPKRVALTRPIYSTAPARAGAIPKYLDTVAHHDYEFSQYVDVNGIKMPAILQHHDDGLNYQENLQYQFNVDYDPKLFERGPRIEDGPQGWRKREK